MLIMINIQLDLWDFWLFLGYFDQVLPIFLIDSSRFWLGFVVFTSMKKLKNKKNDTVLGFVT